MSFDQALKTALENVVDAVNALDTTPAAEIAAVAIDAERVKAGALSGWDMVASGGTPDQPTLLTYTLGDAEVTAALTWGTTGGESGNVTVVEYTYLAAVIATRTITYNATGDVTARTWS